MKTTITTGWHKANDRNAMTYKQLQYIYDLKTEDNVVGWNFNSQTNAMRQLTKDDASEIIETLKSGGTVEIV